MKLDVEHLAALAKVSLEKGEEVTFEKDLEGMLAYVDQLQALDVSGVEEITHAAPETNKLREDAEPRGHNEKEVVVLRNAFPKEEEGYARVPLIIKK